MDILSPKGQQTLADERFGIAMICEALKCSEVSTPKDRPADADYLLARDKILVSVLEVKCRYQLDIGKLMTEFRGEWLITASKLDRLAQLARALCVPAHGALYLVDDRVILIVRLCDALGELVQARREVTKTQATVNGGIATRENAFVSVERAKLIRVPF